MDAHTELRNVRMLCMAEIQALAKGLKILNLLEHSRNGMGTTEIAKHLSIDKSSASRLLHTLANYGFVEQDEHSTRYLLGPQLLTLGQHLLNRITLRDHARPYLHELVDKTGECAHLAIQAQRQALYIDQVESTAALRVESEIGTLSPLHCTALGKVMLAFGGCRRSRRTQTIHPSHRHRSLHARCPTDADGQSRIRH